jgi:flagellar biosynthesis protein FliQ
MSGDDVRHDRELLQRTAARRTRRGWWFLAGLAVPALVITPIAALAAAGGTVSTGDVAVAFIPALVAVTVGVVLVPWMRRRAAEPEPLAGVDKGTRRAVWQALRTGNARDATIDALAREAADRTVRNSFRSAV